MLNKGQRKMKKMLWIGLVGVVVLFSGFKLGLGEGDFEGWGLQDYCTGY